MENKNEIIDQLDKVFKKENKKEESRTGQNFRIDDFEIEKVYLFMENLIKKYEPVYPSAGMVFMGFL